MFKILLFMILKSFISYNKRYKNCILNSVNIDNNININSTSRLSNIDKKLNSISFGYELNYNYSQAVDTYKSTYALCFPSKMRPRGCEPLILPSKRNISAVSIPIPPCIDGLCPYVKFKCSRGHEWKAIPRSPVCFHCPICKFPKKIVGFTDNDLANNNMKETNIIYSLNDKVNKYGGSVISKKLDPSDRWKSTIELECKNGHTWKSTPTNVLINNSWCKKCLLDEKTILLCKETATYFNGNFLGFIENYDDPNIYFEHYYNNKIHRKTIRTKAQKRTKIPLWKCETGHEFALSLQNIRRKEGGKRKCSWCPMCRKNGLIFEWRL